MKTESEFAPTKRVAWETLTPPGVAAFAGARWGRLLLVQGIFAILAAIIMVWFFRTAWFPTVRAAIQQLPAQGEICANGLRWPGDSPCRLAEGDWLGLTVDLEHGGRLRTSADIELEFGRHDVRVWSLLGYRDWRYPPGRIIAFNRTELEPWWGAWHLPILPIAFASVIVGLMVAWTILATFYCVPVWLAGFFANRSLSAWGSWKLASAALLPGSVVADIGILLYGLGTIDLVGLLAAMAGHVVVGWMYVAISPLFAPKLAGLVYVRGNPFSGRACKPSESLVGVQSRGTSHQAYSNSLRF